ncbi:TfpX/TfpZ family type IV pilin accessory protein [Acinetobacter marinus]
MRFLASHLFISFLFALVVILIVFFIWYPYPLAKATGVTHIFLILIFVDIIMGPLLCFVVYNESKKSLKFDLGAIIFLQLIALIYGMNFIAAGRPVWIAYNVDQFELIRNNELVINSKEKGTTLFQATWFKPKYVGVQFSTDQKIKSDDMFDEIFNGISIAQKPARYVPFTQVSKMINEKAQELSLLNKYNDPELVWKVIEKNPSATAFVPLKANAIDMTVLINKEKGEVVKIVDLRPWK